MADVRLRLVILSLALSACGEAPPVQQPVAPAATSATVAAPVAGGADYLVVAPRDYAEALAPLIAHRRGTGHRAELLLLEDMGQGGVLSATALRDELRRLNHQGGGALRFVFLVGDIPRPDEQPRDHVASFYLPKVDYHTHAHEEEHLFHRSLLRVDPEHDHDQFPSDVPFGEMEEGRPASVMVGRLPARDADEVRAYVRKVLAYETRPQGSWRRRLVVRAGPARFGAAVDALLEATALGMLDEQVSYDYDLDFVFAKPGSPYSYRLDRLGEKLTEQADDGAFLLAYVGHSSPAYFDSVSYRGHSYSIGSRADFERMHVHQGAPIFVSLSCDVGAFDMSKGRRSIAEEVVLNPSGGIASFAASRVSHPYPNMLYGEALIDQLLDGRAETVGEAFARIRADMQARSNLISERLAQVDGKLVKREHAALYNLFGDPAVRLRYPADMSLNIEGEPKPGAPLEVQLDAGDLDADALVTLETRRSKVRRRLRPAEEIDALPLEQALAAMEQNHANATDKVIHHFEARLVDGKAQVAITAPDEPGEYVVKVMATGQQGSAWAHRFFQVR